MYIVLYILVIGFSCIELDTYTLGHNNVDGFTPFHYYYYREISI